MPPRPPFQADRRSIFVPPPPVPPPNDRAASMGGQKFRRHNNWSSGGGGARSGQWRNDDETRLRKREQKLTEREARVAEREERVAVDLKHVNALISEFGAAERLGDRDLMQRISGLTTDYVRDVLKALWVSGRPDVAVTMNTAFDALPHHTTTTTPPAPPPSLVLKEATASEASSESEKEEESEIVAGPSSPDYEGGENDM